ncbi:sigma factor [Desulfurispora thermophila]|uniref:sigma factor n=1 Tax=Desulfurispora thermophila TaxID=265470 RepID=UPI000372D4ED|nr:sigma factor [Desulfurispora thermophila]
MLAGIWTLLTLFTSGLTLLVSYITTNAFPHPLSEEEESRYIEKMLQGDKESRDILTRHNLRLVAHVVKKFDLGSELADDLISIGTIGLLKALDTYRPDKGTRLATYACRCVENDMLMTDPMH